MERGKVSDGPESGPQRTANSIIVLAILFLLTLAFSIFSLVLLMYNGDFSGNWNHLTTFKTNL